MKATTTKTVQVTLVLDKDEAEWLKGVVQNPILINDFSDENPHDYAMRSMFFEALQKALP